MCLPRLPIAKVVLNVLHSGSRSSRPPHLLNLLLFTQLWFYLANTSRASPFQAGSTGAPLWMSHPHAALMETVSRAEPCTRGVRWRSFCRAQEVPLPPLPPSRSRWQSCCLRPPLPVHWPVSLYLLLALDTANFPTTKSGSRIKIRLKLWRVGNGVQPPPAKPLLVLPPQQH